MLGYHTGTILSGLGGYNGFRNPDEGIYEMEAQDLGAKLGCLGDVNAGGER